jgi:hypothetical protein
MCIRCPVGLLSIVKICVSCYPVLRRSDLSGADVDDAIGAFKRVWAEFDTGRTGYIKRRDLIKFFSVSLHHALLIR